MSTMTRCNNCAAPGADVQVYRVRRFLQVPCSMDSFILCKDCWEKREHITYYLPEFLDLDTANEVLVTMLLTGGHQPSMEDLLGKVPMSLM